jgi:hypothetical protein
MTSQEPNPAEVDVDEAEVFAPATPGAEALGTEAATDPEES